MKLDPEVDPTTLFQGVDEIILQRNFDIFTEISEDLAQQSAKL